MKIAFLGPAYPFRGGIAQFIELLAKQFDKEHQVKIFTFHKQYPKLIFPGKEQQDRTGKTPNIEIEPVLTPYNPITWPSAVKKIKKWQPDLLIFKYWIPFFAPAFGYIVRRLKCKTVCLIDNIEFHEKWLFAEKFTRYALGNCDLLFTMSAAVWQDAKCIFPQKQIVEAFHPPYDCYNQQKYTKQTAKQKLELTDKRVILFFGYIKPYKGLDLLIAAFSKLKKQLPNLHLLIVGEVYGDDQVYFDMLRDFDVAADTTFINRFVSDVEVELYFKAADVLALPYKQATQSGVLHIAYDMGLGAVSTPQGGLPELIEDGKTGLVAKETTAQAISTALASYLELDLEKISANCIAKSKESSWSKLAELIIKKVQAET
ncbi:MAG: hypothetical protein PWQ09_1016 [Candidatus Cloacimonadota bacterium]|jgi:glycosyltransferase involved in cell wall biosynthesis|nr:hypothetical protein [Candidatus Cloacimonadota bacterium]